MKEFDIELAKKGAPLITIDGRKARVICYDCKPLHHLVALIEAHGVETTRLYDRTGRCISGKETMEDLKIDDTATKVGYINIHRVGDDHSGFNAFAVGVFERESDAIGCKHVRKGYITTIKVVWLYNEI